MYQLRFPVPALAPYIENYWFVTPDQGPVDLRVDVFVDGRPDLIFNQGAPYVRQVIGGPPVTHTASNLDAQRLVPIRITQQGLVRVVGVRFRLGGLGPFTPSDGGKRRDLRRFTNHTPPPQDVLGDDVIELERTVADADPDAAARALDAWFLGHRVVDAAREGFERALATLVETGGRASVADVADRVGASTRQVERWFATHVGLGAKTVARVIRFQASLKALMRDPGCSLADVAIEAGYFDQAHFIRDFRRMTGGVPRGYRGYYPEQGPYDFAPNVVAFDRGA
jgi:AraC-like DNA-binding protein